MAGQAFSAVSFPKLSFFVLELNRFQSLCWQAWNSQACIEQTSTSSFRPCLVWCVTSRFCGKKLPVLTEKQSQGGSEVLSSKWCDDPSTFDFRFFSHLSSLYFCLRANIAEKSVKIRTSNSIPKSFLTKCPILLGTLNPLCHRRLRHRSQSSVVV